VTTLDANMLRRVREKAVRPTAVCLEMDEGRYEHFLQP
jgi:pheromone shutdown protein TraB